MVGERHIRVGWFQVAGFHVTWVFGSAGIPIVVLDIVSKMVNSARLGKKIAFLSGRCDGSLI